MLGFGDKILPYLSAILSIILTAISWSYSISLDVASCTIEWKGVQKMTVLIGLLMVSIGFPERDSNESVGMI